MDAEDLIASLDIRAGYHHLTIKPSGTQQSRIKDIRAVCGRDQDYPFI